MRDFLFVWFVSGVLGLVASYCVHEEGDELAWPRFGDVIHPMFVAMLSLVAFILGPFTWVFWVCKKVGL